MNAFSHEQVFELEQEQLVAVSLSQGDKLLELKGNDNAGGGNGNAHVIEGAVGIHDVFFHIFAHQKADGLQELTYILLELSAVDVEHKLTTLAIENETDLGGEQLSHVRVGMDKYRIKLTLFRNDLNKI